MTPAPKRRNLMALLRDERGSSLLEVMLLGLLLTTVLIWLLAVLSDVHRAALATTAGAREAGFDAARSTEIRSAGAAADTAIRRALLDGGLDPGSARVRWDAPDGLMRGGRVEVEVAYPVPVIRAPFLGSWGGAVVWVRAIHTARIDPYGSRP